TAAAPRSAARRAREPRSGCFSPRKNNFAFSFFFHLALLYSHRTPDEGAKQKGAKKKNEKDEHDFGSPRVPSDGRQRSRPDGYRGRDGGARLCARRRFVYEERN